MASASEPEASTLTSLPNGLPIDEDLDEWTKEKLRNMGPVVEGQPYPDLIRFPNEPPKPKEVWEVEPVYEWETDERGFMYEERLEAAEEHRIQGNAHFKNAEAGDDGEWELALRRYRRAIYFCHFDELQLHDFTAHHRAQAEDINMQCKLNLVACVCKMYELGNKALPEGSLDHAVNQVNDVLQYPYCEFKPKLYYRKAQVHLLQGDLVRARGAMDNAYKFGGQGGDLRQLFNKLRRLEREERQRERALYGGKIQATSVHKKQEAIAAVQDARKALVRQTLYVIFFPIIALYKLFAALRSSVSAFLTLRRERRELEVELASDLAGKTKTE
jgi:hypothetical protein